MGLGCAPIIPCLIHQTPRRFGLENSQSMIGIQLAFASLGSIFSPPIAGFITDRFGLFYFPYILLLFGVGMFLLIERCKKSY